MDTEEPRAVEGGAAQASPLTVAVPTATTEANAQTPILRAEDFTNEPVPRGGLEQPEYRPYDPAPARERVRTWTAIILVGTLLFSIFASFVTIWVGFFMDQYPSDPLIDVLTLIYTPLVGLVGAVAGFYYGTKERS